MKKLFLIIVCILAMAGVVPQINADEITQTKIFDWTQTDLTGVIEWKLWWSDVSGGPYGSSIGTFTYDGSAGPTFSSSNELIVTGDSGTSVAKFFILKACGDVLQEDGSTIRECSEASNEATYTFWIPAGAFSAPVNFGIRDN